jgi:hypothetical protein
MRLDVCRVSAVLALAMSAACVSEDPEGEVVASASEAVTAVGRTGFAPSPGEVCDATIQAHWQRHTYLGAPVQATDQLLPDGGRFRDYAAGTIILNPRFGCAYVVRFGFWERWKAEGRTLSLFGYPVSDELWDGHGSFQYFEGGSMWWTQDRGVRGLYGDVAVKHHEVRPWGGYPLADAMWTSELGGQKVVLEHGHEIYRTKTTGAHAVRYGILQKYLELGAERSTLGFPITDEICEPGHCFSDFQGGRLDWLDGVGVRVMHTVEDVAVWRLQLEVQVCDVSGAGTDDEVFVELAGAAGKRFFVDSEANDFERGSTRRYDLSPAVLGISRVSDVQRLTVGKTAFSAQKVWDGQRWVSPEAPSQAYDDLCLARVALYVNQRGATAGDPSLHRPLFNQTFAPQRWLTSGTRSTTVDAAALRAQALWSTARVPSVKGLANFLTFPELESIITGSTGHMLTNGDAQFGDLHGRAVEVTRAGGDRVHVDLDLEVDALDDPEADVDFDVHFVCSGSSLVFQVENVVLDVDPAWYQPLSALALLFYTPTLPAISNVTLGTPFCPTVLVLDGSPGTVSFW